MDNVNWREEFNLGIELFDKQHKLLISLLDRLIDAYNSPEHSDDIENLLLELMDNTQSHFEDEESYMARHDFENLQEHIAHHREFAVKSKELKRLSMLADKPVPVALVLFLRKWLINHIREEDRKYRDCLNNKS
jgi:hemerythrin